MNDELPTNLRPPSAEELPTNLRPPSADLEEFQDSIAQSSADAEGFCWLDVTALDELEPDTGACALVDGMQIALIRVGDGDTVYAIANKDPFSDAYVLSRGIVGDAGGVPKIASPMFKQSFDLRTGVCLDDASVQLPTWPVRVRGGRVEILLQAFVPQGVAA